MSSAAAGNAPKPSPQARLTLLALAAAAWLWVGHAAAASPPHEEPPVAGTAPQLWLYTVGPGAPTFERFGHTLLCETRERSAKCWDFGRWDDTDTERMVRASLAGKPAFGITAVPLDPTLDAFQVQDRKVERQRLPLDRAAHSHLVTELERRMRDGYRYPYHPLTRNCATELRDLLDEVTAGKLKRAALSLPTTSTSYRELAREGLRGKVLELALVILLVGRADDRRPTTWERAFLPEDLAALASLALGTPRELVLTERLPPLPQSKHAGDLVLLAFTLLLVVWMLRARRERGFRVALGALGAVTTSVGLVRLLAPLVCAYPEVAWGPELLVVPPTDLVLPWLSPGARRAYLRLRCTAAGAALALGLLAEPPWVPLGFATISLLPVLAALVCVELRARRQAEG